MSAGQSSSHTIDSGQPFNSEQRHPPHSAPVLAMVLTFLGDFVYLGFGVGFFIGFAVSGLFSYVFAILFVSTVGVVACVILMAVKPKLHHIWGITVLALTTLAIAIDESTLYHSFDYAFSIIGSGAILGVILWSIPIGMVLVGGVLAILWKPPIDSIAKNA